MEINMNDVKSVVSLCKPQLIAIGVALVLAGIVAIAVKGMRKPGRGLVRGQCLVAALIALVWGVNAICLGPVRTLLDLTSSGSSLAGGDTMAEALRIGEEIAGEGIVLLENRDGILPMEKGNVNVFGWASVHPRFGGTGSGSLSTDYETVSLLQGLEHSGFVPNAELVQMYESYVEELPKIAVGKQDWTLPEPTASAYDDALMESAKAYSDIAFIVIGRPGGEGFDLPTRMGDVIYNDNSDTYHDFEPDDHYLKLSRTERDMIDLVCRNFNDVVLIYNGANPFELGFIEDYTQIKAVVWCPGPGQTGFNGLGDILCGDINPSGKTPDIFVRDLQSTPYARNFGNFHYDNLDEHVVTTQLGKKSTPTFVNLVEGIYVGYRFYETAADEGFLNYDEQVLYPFGYGLSYTSFEKKMGELSEKNGVISVDITVTNTGDRDGKEVVELYCNPPYTDGGIEKASANLVAFAKTGLLKPGASEKVTLRFKVEDMAAYDALNRGCYVLEQGDYKISLRNDSHTLLDEKVYTVAAEVVYGEGKARSTDTIAATNRFVDAASNIEYLSRKGGFANFEAATAAPVSFSMPEAQKAALLTNLNYDPTAFNNADDPVPAQGVANELKLADLRGAALDDPRWETLLDEMSLQEMLDLIALSGYHTPEIASVGKLATVDCDGPASINNSFANTASVGFPCTIVLSSTWNSTLAGTFGEMMGVMADEMDVSGWYAPAVNIHRSAFGGRNFEYYSEDGLLAGKMAASVVRGAMKSGVYTYVKHFALNNQDTNRTLLLCTWVNEQALREIYLKPFELAVKEGGTTAIMSSMNCIGEVPTAASYPLLTEVLREEWGFKGMVLTDTFSGYGYQNADRFIRAGNDGMLSNFDTDENYVKDTDSGTSRLAMRNACKNIMYTVVNSRAYAAEDADQRGKPVWMKTLIGTDIAALLLVLLLEALFVLRYRRSKPSKR